MIAITYNTPSKKHYAARITRNGKTRYYYTMTKASWIRLGAVLTGYTRRTMERHGDMIVTAMHFTK